MIMLEWIWDYLKNRLGEGKTWAIICAAIAAAGAALTDAQIAAITAAGVAVYGMLSLLFPNVFGKKE